MPPGAPGAARSRQEAPAARGCGYFQDPTRLSHFGPFFCQEQPTPTRGAAMNPLPQYWWPCNLPVWSTRVCCPLFASARWLRFQSPPPPIRPPLALNMRPWEHGNMGTWEHGSVGVLSGLRILRNSYHGTEDLGSGCSSGCARRPVLRA